MHTIALKWIGFSKNTIENVTLSQPICPRGMKIIAILDVPSGSLDKYRKITTLSRYEAPLLPTLPTILGSLLT